MRNMVALPNFFLMKAYITLVICGLMTHIAIAQSLPGQVNLPFAGKNPAEFRVDDLSDKQINEGFERAYNKGYSDTEIYNILELNGVSSIEISKLRERKSAIQNRSTQLIESDKERNDLIEFITEPSSNTPAEKDSVSNTEVTTTLDESSNASKKSDIYGLSPFRNGSISFFQKTVDFEAPDNYIIGVGDRISVNIWGYSDFSGSYIVENWGGISDNNIDRIYLRGMRWGKARSLLKSRFQKVFDKTNSQYEINISYSRELSVSIVGEVKNPGTYKIPAINSVFNALIAAEGPKRTGSLRSIQVIRDGKSIAELDVYKYLQAPKSQDFFLENGDVILIPLAMKTVEISGEVRRPMFYQLKPEEGLQDLIAYAGGTTATAYLKNIHLERFEQNQKKTVKDIDLTDPNLKKVPLSDQDKIIINRIPENIENFVEISGSVGLPGKYEFIPNEKILDLIRRANGLNINTYTSVAYLFRRRQASTEVDVIPIPLDKVIQSPSSVDNMKLELFDEIKIFANKDFSDEHTIEVAGAVREPLTFPFANGLRIADAINLCKGLTRDAYLKVAYIIRSTESRTSYIEVNLEQAISAPESTANLLLKENDILRIYTLDDFRDDFDVEIFGAVREPKRYVYSEGITMYDLITLSGGLLFDASDKIEISTLDNNGSNPTQISSSKIYQVDIEDGLLVNNEKSRVPLSPFDQVYVRRKFDAKIKQNVTIIGEVKYPGVYALQDQKERISDIIQRAGGLTDVAEVKAASFYRADQGLGEIVLNLDKALKNKKSTNNYYLLDGDVVTIPSRKSFVGIKGAIDYPIDSSRSINAPYIGGRSARWYINRYGNGFSKEAKRKRTYVRQPNGDIDRTRELFWINFYPKVDAGATVYSLRKIEKTEEGEKKQIDWNKAIENVTIKLTGILTIWVLADRLSN